MPAPAASRSHLKTKQDDELIAFATPNEIFGKKPHAPATSASNPSSSSPIHSPSLKAQQRSATGAPSQIPAPMFPNGRKYSGLGKPFPDAFPGDLVPANSNLSFLDHDLKPKRKTHATGASQYQQQHRSLCAGRGGASNMNNGDMPPLPPNAQFSASQTGSLSLPDSPQYHDHFNNGQQGNMANNGDFKKLANHRMSLLPASLNQFNQGFNGKSTTSLPDHVADFSGGSNIVHRKSASDLSNDLANMNLNAAPPVPQIPKQFQQELYIQQYTQGQPRTKGQPNGDSIPSHFEEQLGPKEQRFSQQQGPQLNQRQASHFKLKSSSGEDRQPHQFSASFEDSAAGQNGDIPVAPLRIANAHSGTSSSSQQISQGQHQSLPRQQQYQQKPYQQTPVPQQSYPAPVPATVLTQYDQHYNNFNDPRYNRNQAPTQRPQQQFLNNDTSQHQQYQQHQFEKQSSRQQQTHQKQSPPRHQPTSPISNIPGAYLFGGEPDPQGRPECTLGHQRDGSSVPSDYGHHPTQQQQPQPQQQQQRVEGHRLSNNSLAIEEKLRFIFESVNVSGLGALNAAELQKALLNTDNSKFNIRTVEIMVRVFDKTGRGAVSFREFYHLWTYISKWRKVFLEYARVDSGVAISLRQYEEALQSLGYRMGTETVGYIFGLFATEGEKDIDQQIGIKTLKLDMFVESLIWLMKSTSSFKKFDVQRNGVGVFPFDSYVQEILSFRYL